MSKTEDSVDGTCTFPELNGLRLIGLSRQQVSFFHYGIDCPTYDLFRVTPAMASPSRPLKVNPLGTWSSPPEWSLCISWLTEVDTEQARKS